MSYVSCDTQNLIYYIKCAKCDIYYIGETGTSLRQRICQHRSCIRLNYDTPVAEHFSGSDHDEADIMVGVLAQNNTWSILKRKEIEGDFIRRFDTHAPQGLNIIKPRRTKRIVLPYVSGTPSITKIKEITCCKIIFKTQPNIKKQFLLSTKNKIA